MATCAEMCNTGRRWQLRATVIIIGIVTMIFCCVFLIYYTILLLEDLRGLYRGNTVWRVPGDTEQFLLNMDASIDAGLIGMCRFLLFPTTPQNQGAQNPTSAPNSTIKKRRIMDMMKLRLGRDAQDRQPFYLQETTPMHRKLGKPNLFRRTNAPVLSENVNPLGAAVHDEQPTQRTASERLDTPNHSQRHRPLESEQLVIEAETSAPTMPNQLHASGLRKSHGKSRNLRKAEFSEKPTALSPLQRWKMTQSTDEPKWWQIAYISHHTEKNPPDLPRPRPKNMSGFPANYSYSRPFPFPPVFPPEDKCQVAVERERDAQHAALYNERHNLYKDTQGAIQAVFIVLDILLLIICTLGLISGYLLIIGGFRKNRHYLVLWLMISFLVAWGVVWYGVGHYFLGHGFLAGDIVPIIIIILAIFIIIGLHAWAFWAVSRYFVHLWEPEAKPNVTVRKMKLILSKRTE